MKPKFDESSPFYEHYEMNENSTLFRSKATARCICGGATEWFVKDRKSAAAIPVCGPACPTYLEALRDKGYWES